MSTININLKIIKHMIYKGLNEVSSMYYNGKEIIEAYLGDKLVYNGFSPVCIHAESQTVLYVKKGTDAYGGGSYKEFTLYFSLDNGITWETMTTANVHNITIPEGKKLLIKGDNPGGFYTFVSERTWFNIVGTCSISGNIMSLLDSNGNIRNGVPNYAFYELFYASTIKDASALVLPAQYLGYCCYEGMFASNSFLEKAPVKLPSVSLPRYCYYRMFKDCIRLTTAPELPATGLDIGCYNCMFQGCRSLTTAPELPATTLATYSYQYMFDGCTNLNYIKCLATDISASNCTDKWVNRVASNGTFVKDANMTDWTTGVGGIPSGWTVQDAE